MILNFNEIFEDKKNLTVAIYGAGGMGATVKKLLNIVREDIEVKFFLDQKGGFYLGDTPVINLDDYSKLNEKVDLILIASRFYSAIERCLTRYFITNYKIILPEKTTRLLKLLNAPLPYVNPIGDDFLIQTKKAEEILFSTEDKEIYREFVDFWVDPKNHQEKILKRFLSNPDIYYYQYLDFINKNVIGNMIEGGIAAGATTVQFINAFANLKSIHCFDIFADEFLQEPFKTTLQRSEKVFMNAKGLLDKTSIISAYLNEQVKGQSAIKTNVDNKIDLMENNNIEKIKNYKVNTVSIDEYVKEKNIDKVDFIKLDIEGAEFEALKGAQNTILKDRPQIAVCLYHKTEDLYEIPLYLKEITENYIFRIKHYAPIRAEFMLYAIPAELYVN